MITHAEIVAMVLERYAALLDEDQVAFLADVLTANGNIDRYLFSELAISIGTLRSSNHPEARAHAEKIITVAQLSPELRSRALNYLQNPTEKI